MITITGLGPGDLDRVPGSVRSFLLNPEHTVVVRTREHPASVELEQLRPVVFCDDLYEDSESFDEVYSAIADRVIEASRTGPVVYAVPGSPFVGEFAVRKLLDSGEPVEVIPAESFVDAVLTAVRYDPLDRGLQILNGHDLPDPLVLDKPTIVGHLDTPEALVDVCARIDRVMPDGATLTVLSGLGAADESVTVSEPGSVAPALAGLRTSLFIDAPPAGLIGAVHTMRRLREECPWDREQTHETLVKNLIEESYELIDAISALGDAQPDWVAYSAVEDELGDVLLQVLFHSVIARQAGVFDIDDVASVMREKLIRRHPHVFGDVEALSADEVKANWDRIKEAERGDQGDTSAMSGVIRGLPALQRASKIQNRAAKVGFDWEEAPPVMAKVEEELDELRTAISAHGDLESELGDVLFSIVNLARHLGLDSELALRGATNRFEARFRHMEAEGPLDDLDLSALDERWERAKSQEQT